MDLPSIFKIEIQPFKKTVFSLAKGGIDNMYSRMYEIAESLAIHEMNKFEARVRFYDAYDIAVHGKESKDYVELTKEIAKFRDERVKYHMQEMKEILFKYLETEKNKKK